jgi:hypothetical protein
MVCTSALHLKELGLIPWASFDSFVALYKIHLILVKGSVFLILEEHIEVLTWLEISFHGFIALYKLSSYLLRSVYPS